MKSWLLSLQSVAFGLFLQDEEENQLYSGFTVNESDDDESLFKVKIIASPVKSLLEVSNSSGSVKVVDYYIKLTDESIILLSVTTNSKSGGSNNPLPSPPLPVFIWNLRDIRRYGSSPETFTLEAGRRCESGPGIFSFGTSKGTHLFSMLSSILKDLMQRDQNDKKSIFNLIDTTNSNLNINSSHKIILNTSSQHNINGHNIITPILSNHNHNHPNHINPINHLQMQQSAAAAVSNNNNNNQIMISSSSHELPSSTLLSSPHLNFNSNPNSCEAIHHVNNVNCINQHQLSNNSCNNHIQQMQICSIPVNPSSNSQMSSSSTTKNHLTNGSNVNYHQTVGQKVATQSSGAATGVISNKSKSKDGNKNHHHYYHSTSNLSSSSVSVAKPLKPPRKSSRDDGSISNNSNTSCQIEVVSVMKGLIQGQNQKSNGSCHVKTSSNSSILSCGGGSSSPSSSGGSSSSSGGMISSSSNGHGSSGISNNISNNSSSTNNNQSSSELQLESMSRGSVSPPPSPPASTSSSTGGSSSCAVLSSAATHHHHEISTNATQTSIMIKSKSCNNLIKKLNSDQKMKQQNNQKTQNLIMSHNNHNHNLKTTGPQIMRGGSDDINMISSDDYNDDDDDENDEDDDDDVNPDYENLLTYNQNFRNGNHNHKKPLPPVTQSASHNPHQQNMKNSDDDDYDINYSRIKDFTSPKVDGPPPIAPKKMVMTSGRGVGSLLPSGFTGSCRAFPVQTTCSSSSTSASSSVLSIHSSYAKRQMKSRQPLSLPPVPTEPSSGSSSYGITSVTGSGLKLQQTPHFIKNEVEYAVVLKDNKISKFSSS